ncbi:(deoxy)nucleoside triphosphate pyrophosphohydrolase [Desulfovirgula thermocuniculi]|uniref:(deoxy)nucleoside triphosphate pyrophosphohydrolase n=1 Tax=Desulfovirgula thermocuniculi TaxID=348842 RepID=UPI000412ED58|nr:(deoxy)nucleoside triphosphate pyrophosphohydrolase [Desulfovirgula thermocuniculi]
MVEVAAAVIVKNGRVLIAQRREDDKLPLKWEFPGGKVEAGETPEECLVREMREEFSIDISVGDCICASEFEYEHISVRLTGYFAEWLGGSLRPAEHRQIRWVLPSELDGIDFAPADVPIAEEVKRRLLQKKLVCGSGGSRMEGGRQK